MQNYFKCGAILPFELDFIKNDSKSTVKHYKQSGYFMDYLAARGAHDSSGINMDTINACLQENEIGYAVNGVIDSIVDSLP